MGPYYSAHDIAKLWGVSYNTVLGLINMGKLQAFKAGREWRITESALRDYENRPAARATKTAKYNLKIV